MCCWIKLVQLLFTDLQQYNRAVKLGSRPIPILPEIASFSITVSIRFSEANSVEPVHRKYHRFAMDDSANNLVEYKNNPLILGSCMKGVGRDLFKIKYN